MSTGWSGDTLDWFDHGRYRLTREGADICLARNRRSNRLAMLAEHLGGLREFAPGKSNWYVFYSDTWYAGSTTPYEPDKVYMTEEVATKNVSMLNNGEYTL